MTVTRTDDLQLLLGSLPESIQEALDRLDREDLVEVVMDLGRPPQARFPGEAVNLREDPISTDDIAEVVHQIGEFGSDNRAGIEGTLHRISAIRNRQGRIIGLTLRVGRAVFGTIDLIRDLIETGRSTLLLGPPGVGKTTRLREVARVLADDFNKRVVIIDTSNEIAGDGDIPHPAIGGARRMQVPHPNEQHRVMIEAVENHMPEVIVVDEIGTAAETLAARTIAERGVQLIGTAHGNTLENLVQNPTLADLIGGIQTVTLTDEEARLRGTQKTVNERKGPPSFDAVVELLDREALVVHATTGAAVDRLLRGLSPGGQRRRPAHQVQQAPWEPEVPAVPRPPARHAGGIEPPGHARPVAIYPYAISRDQTERVIRDLRLNARTVLRAEGADLIISLRSRDDDPRLRRLLEFTGAPVHVVKRNTTAQIRRLLQKVFNEMPDEDDTDEDASVDAAVHEAEEAVRHVLEEGEPAELPPRPSALRKLQHRVVNRHHLLAESEGQEPERHLVIYPP